MNFPEPGRKRGESKEEGMARRHKEGHIKTRAWLKDIHAREAVKLAEARTLVEGLIGSFDDVPLGKG
jgi:hypothetical protein